MSSAFIGGWTDLGFQRLMDAVLSLPALVLAISLAGVIGPGVTTAMIAIGIVILPSANRVVRASTLGVTQTAYIEAARSLGVTNTRILWRHVLPNVMAPIIVLASIVMGFAIVVEASLRSWGWGRL
jgi:peptide/nickel transport system permease protein